MESLDLTQPQLSCSVLEEILTAVRSRDEPALGSLLASADLAQRLVTNDQTRIQAILLLRSKIAYLRKNHAQQVADHWGPILIDEILTNDIKLSTLLYLATEPEAVLRMWKYNHKMRPILQDVSVKPHDRTISNFIRVYRDYSPAMCRASRSRYNYFNPTADHPPGYISYYIYEAAKHGHIEILEILLPRHPRAFSASLLLKKAVRRRQLGSVQVIARHVNISQEVAPFVCQAVMEIAVGNNDLDMVDLLISQGIDARHIDRTEKISNLEILRRYADPTADRTTLSLISVARATLNAGSREGFDFMQQYAKNRNIQLNLYHNLVYSSIRGDLFDIFCWLLDHLVDFSISFIDIARVIILYDRVEFIHPFMYPNYPEIHQFLMAGRQGPSPKHLGSFIKEPVDDPDIITSWRHKMAWCINGYLIQQAEIYRFSSNGGCDDYQVLSLLLKDSLFPPAKISVMLDSFRFKKRDMLIHLAYLPSTPSYAPTCQRIAEKVLTAKKLDLELLDILIQKGADPTPYLPKPKSGFTRSWQDLIPLSNETLRVLMPLIVSRIFFEWWREADTILDFVLARGLSITNQCLRGVLQRRPGGYSPWLNSKGPTIPQMTHLWMRLLLPVPTQQQQPHEGITDISTLPGWAMRYQQTPLLELIRDSPHLGGDYNGMLESATYQGRLDYAQLARSRGARHPKLL